jgi:cell division protein FtsI/penicillin-binding protein 2
MAAEQKAAEVRLTDETIEYLETKMAEAVRQGMRDVLTDKETVGAFFSAAVDAFQTRASEKTGEFVLGGLKVALHRAAWFFGLGLIVYSVGGWTAVAKVWAAVWGSHG